MSEPSIKEIGEMLASALNLRARPVSVYGSDQVPKNGINVASVGNCIACAIYKIAASQYIDPVYFGDEPCRPLCRCPGGPAWFGYRAFDPGLIGLMAAGSGCTKNPASKCLKASEEVALETFGAVGRIAPMGRYVIIRSCEAMRTDPGVRCIICFATGGQIRDLCALFHFRSRDIFDLISVPWGPACATLITYPAGMAMNASVNRIYLGPTDPSAREWMPEDCMALGIPIEIARTAAEDIERSFVARKAQDR